MRCVWALQRRGAAAEAGGDRHQQHRLERQAEHVTPNTARARKSAMASIRLNSGVHHAEYHVRLRDPALDRLLVGRC